jgi:hypothetical protein
MTKGGGMPDMGICSDRITNRDKEMDERSETDKSGKKSNLYSQKELLDGKNKKM